MAGMYGDVPAMGSRITRDATEARELVRRIVSPSFRSEPSSPRLRTNSSHPEPRTHASLHGGVVSRRSDPYPPRVVAEFSASAKNDDELGTYPAILRNPIVDGPSDRPAGTRSRPHEERRSTLHANPWNALREVWRSIARDPGAPASAGGGTRNGQYLYVRPLPAGGRGALNSDA